MTSELALRGQLERLDQRVGAMAELMRHERSRLEAEITQWRDELAAALAKLLAVETANARQSKTINRMRELLEWLADRSDDFARDRIHQVLYETDRAA